MHNCSTQYSNIPQSHHPMICTQSLQKLLIMIISRVKQPNCPLNYPGAAFCWFQPSCYATSQTVYDWQSSLSGCRCPTLEQLAWHRAGWFAVNLSAPTETLSVPAVLLRYCTVTDAQLCYCDTLSGPSGGSS